MAQAEVTTSRSMTKFSDEEIDTILNDYRLAVISREASLLGRKEVLTGKGKFGIFGDGKELPQIAMAKRFRDGDFRAGYYRDQTFMMAIGVLTVQDLFAQLYGHADVEAEPASAGRQMNNHFATRSLNDDGTWKKLTEMKNTSSDVSPVSGQMGRMLGLAQASKVYRENELLSNHNKFSDNGNEVVFGTIGDSSTTEGIFWETVNAAGVLQVPMVLSVWDDGYGISVPTKYQTTKKSISAALKGFQRTEELEGVEILRVKGWDYPELIETYKKADTLAREDHVPVIVHVQELTQPQGHSTSGSHERYKSKERLQWEEEFNCNTKFREWILDNDIATDDELKSIEKEAVQHVREEKRKAWQADQTPLKKEFNEVIEFIDRLSENSAVADKLGELKKELKNVINPIRRNIYGSARKALHLVRNEPSDARSELIAWLKKIKKENEDRYDSHVYSETELSPMHVDEVKPEYDDNAEMVDGRIVLRDNFEAILNKHPEVLIFGEDSGRLGGVNLGLEGLQEKFGELRVGDTGIREATIVGQGIGMALRGLRPISEIQYIDYLLFCYQIMSDDLATTRYRTKSGQKAPLIVRTRGHRLEGIWHSGSPMGIIVHGMRGIHVCVPRNLTQAAGLYNTILRGDDPALIVEPLNAYRLKEQMPSNLGEFTVPLGVPEIVKEGTDVTVVSYGSTLNIATSVVDQLNEDFNISVELIDVRTLLPFDINHTIVESLKKTNRILFLDEDMPGATTAYMMQKVLEEQNGYFYLDSEPATLTAKNHRPAYGSDGDYFSKPNAEDILEAIYAMMHEANPSQYPAIFE